MGIISYTNGRVSYMSFWKYLLLDADTALSDHVDVSACWSGNLAASPHPTPVLPSVQPTHTEQCGQWKHEPSILRPIRDKN